MQSNGNLDQQRQRVRMSSVMLFHKVDVEYRVVLNGVVARSRRHRCSSRKKAKPALLGRKRKGKRVANRMKAGRAKQGAAENYRDLLLYANRRAERIFEVATAARSLERPRGEVGADSAKIKQEKHAVRAKRAKWSSTTSASPTAKKLDHESRDADVALHGNECEAVRYRSRYRRRQKRACPLSLRRVP